MVGATGSLQRMAEGSRSLALRHCPIRFLLVEHLDIAQMA
jgi:hypothetical protein